MPPLAVRSLAMALLAAFLNGFAAPAHAQPVVRPEVVATFPHDPEAFTQGLLLHQGKLYESTGLIGRSSLRRVAIASGAVEQRVSLPGELFGEGLALVGERLIQLTWQNQVAIVWDLAFSRIASFEYSGEGWGLCHDGEKLVMSDGSSRLFFRDPRTFELVGDVEVRGDRGPVTRLNELECVGSLVFANVWQTNDIVRIDPSSGRVLHVIDGARLLTPSEAAAADVMNGIAFDPATGHFFVTGKLWPKLFELRISFDAGGSGGAGGGSGGPSSNGGTSAREPASAGEIARGEHKEIVTAEPRSRSGCGCAFGQGDPTSAIWPMVLSMAGLRRRKRKAR